MKHGKRFETRPKLKRTLKLESQCNYCCKYTTMENCGKTYIWLHIPTLLYNTRTHGSKSNCRYLNSSHALLFDGSLHLKWLRDMEHSSLAVSYAGVTSSLCTCFGFDLHSDA